MYRTCGAFVGIDVSRRVGAFVGFVVGRRVGASVGADVGRMGCGGVCVGIYKKEESETFAV